MDQRQARTIQLPVDTACWLAFGEPIDANEISDEAWGRLDVLSAMEPSLDVFNLAVPDDNDPVEPDMTMFLIHLDEDRPVRLDDEVAGPALVLEVVEAPGTWPVAIMARDWRSRPLPYADVRKVLYGSSPPGFYEEVPRILEG